MTHRQRFAVDPDAGSYDRNVPPDSLNVLEVTKNLACFHYRVRQNLGYIENCARRHTDAVESLNPMLRRVPQQFCLKFGPKLVAVLLSILSSGEFRAVK